MRPGREWDDSTAVEAAAPEPIPDERIVNNALHKMPDHPWSKPWSCPRNGRRRRTPNKPHQGQKENAADEAMEATAQARERQEEARVAYEQR